MSPSVPANAGAPAGMRWVALAELAGEALPNLMRKVLAHALVDRIAPQRSSWEDVMITSAMLAADEATAA